MVATPAFQKNVGAWLTSAIASTIQDLTAGGAGDNTEIDGLSIDRMVHGGGGPTLSAKFIVAFEAVLAAAATLSLVGNMQHADDNGSGAPGSWADTGDILASAVVATGPGGGGTVRGTAELDVKLSGLKQWIRVQFTPNLSAANTDTAEVVAVAVFGGNNENPD